MKNDIENTQAGSDCQERLVRIFARGVVLTGLTATAVFMLYGATVVWDRSQGIPLGSWLQSLGIVAAISGAVALFMWAARNAKF